MQIRRRLPFKKPELGKWTRVNEMIRVPRVRLIDEQGNNLGAMATREALERARQAESDLVEVNPKAEPPVCKILDFGKFKYEKEKLAHKQKVASKKSEIKGIRLSFKIKDHDLTIRLNQAKKFLSAGNQVKIEMILKGREKAYSHNAKSVIEKFISDLGGEIKVFQPVQKQAGKFSALIGPMKS